MPGLRIVFFLLLATIAFAQTITTIAGGGTGDGRAATNAYLNLPFGLAVAPCVDSPNDPCVLITDQSDQRIRRVNTRSGIISTFAGTGIGGSVDGAVAQAQFNLPTAIRVDAGGNVYVTELLGRRVRKIDASGTVTTIAGNGTTGDPGAGGPALSSPFGTIYGVAADSAGNLVYVADYSANRIMRISAGNLTLIAGTGAAGFSGDGGPANVAQINQPLGLTLDSAGNLYVTDSTNGRIRRITPDGAISTFAGCGTGATTADCPAVNLNNPPPGPATQKRLLNPQDVFAAADGIYILDASGSQAIGVIWRVDGSGTMSLVRAFNAVPAGVTVDAAGNLYFSDSLTHTVQQISGGVVRPFAGGSALDGDLAKDAGLATPSTIRTDGFGNLYIADSNQHRVRRVDKATGIITTVAGNGLPGFFGDNGQARSAGLNGPSGLAFDSDNNLYIADTGNQRVRKVTTAGIISTFAGTGTAGFTGDGGAPTSARLSSPFSLAMDSSNNLYIADRGNRRVRRVAGGTISTYAGNGSTTACAGPSFSCGDNGAATSASFADPRDIAVDAQGNLYVCDAYLPTSQGVVGGFKVRRVDPAGRIATIAGNGTNSSTGDNLPLLSGGVGDCSGIAIDSSGTLFVSDESLTMKQGGPHPSIRRIGATISTLAGTTSGFSGDGGPASQAQFTRPRGLALDLAGNLLVADSGNNRIRQIEGAGSGAPRNMQLVSGGGQSAPVGSVLQDLVVRVVDPAGTVSGVTVTFTADPANLVELNPASGQVATDATGTAAVKALLKSLAGKVTVTATATGLPTVTFALTALPLVPQDGFVNGASFARNTPLAAGAIASLFGQGLAVSTEGAISLPLPTTLSSTQVLVASGSKPAVAAPLFYVSPGQINFLMPFEVSDPTVTVSVTNGSADVKSTVTLGVAPSSPGVFTLNQSGSGAGAILHADFSPVSAANPAAAGEVLLVYCTGLGAVNPPVASGVASPSPPAVTVTLPTVTMQGTSASVEFAGLAPGFAGLYQINVKVPTGLSPGSAVPLVVAMGSRAANTVTIPLR